MRGMEWVGRRAFGRDYRKTDSTGECKMKLDASEKTDTNLQVTAVHTCLSIRSVFPGQLNSVEGVVIGGHGSHCGECDIRNVLHLAQ
jgi:hypothetical protein